MPTAGNAPGRCGARQVIGDELGRRARQRPYIGSVGQADHVAKAWIHRAVNNHHACARALQRVPPGLRLHVRRGTLRHLAPHARLTARCGAAQIACSLACM